MEKVFYYLMSEHRGKVTVSCWACVPVFYLSVMASGGPCLLFSVFWPATLLARKLMRIPIWKSGSKICSNKIRDKK
jgi:hypothetical protein